MLAPMADQNLLRQGADEFRCPLEEETVCLYEDLAAILLRTGIRITKDPEQAQDALQECFLRYFLARREGQVISNPKAWLMRVLRNYLSDARRLSRCDAQVSVDAAGDRPDLGADPYSQTLQAELSSALGARLTSREAECLELKVAGMRQREIADTLGIRPGTVGVILSRAVRKAHGLFGWNRKLPVAVGCNGAG